MESSDGGDDQASGWMQVKKVVFCTFPFVWRSNYELYFHLLWMEIEFCCLVLNYVCDGLEFSC